MRQKKVIKLSAKGSVKNGIRKLLNFGLEEARRRYDEVAALQKQVNELRSDEVEELEWE